MPVRRQPPGIHVILLALRALGHRIITLSAVSLIIAGASEVSTLAANAATKSAAVTPVGSVATPVSAPLRPPLPGLIRDEHLQPAPALSATELSHVMSMPANRRHSEVPAVGGATAGTTTMQSLQTTQATDSSIQLLTRPYTTWHNITSIFDHCNPDYSQDGRVCEFDASTGLRSYGVDPSFYLGYAQTPGGGDYLSYDGHNGWDYSLAYENVLSAAPGTVRLAGIDSVNTCFGQNIIIDHPSGYSTRYAHLSAIYVTPGQVVDRAQVIGQSGNTGCSTGPHLHFGVYITNSWTAVDPWGWSGAPGADPWPSDPGNLWLTGYAQFPVPWAPINVRAISGNASATVSWTPQFDGGRSIVYYVVTASPGGIKATVSGSETSAVVTGLSNGTSYTFTVGALNGIGATSSAASNAITPSAWIGQFRALTPARILDTRNGIGGVARPAAGQTVNIPVVGTGGVPNSGVAAVVLNLTVTDANKPGYLTVFPSGSPRPSTSALNFGAGDTLANLVQVPVGTGGNASIFVGGASASVIADVEGYYTSDVGTGNGLYRALTPARIADTRAGTGLAAPLGANQSADLQVTGLGGIPSAGVSGVVLNVTAAGGSAASWLSVSPSGSGTSGTSNLNFNAGQTVANRVITGVGTGGKVSIHNGAGAVQVVVDVVGWFSDASAAAGWTGRYIGLLPARILDTRYGIGSVATLNPGQALVTVGGQGGVPSGGASAVIFNLTATNGTAPSDFLSLYPSNAAYPNTSDLNFSAGESRANHALSRLGSDGRIALFNAAGRVDAILDVEGYYSS